MSVREASRIASALPPAIKLHHETGRLGDLFLLEHKSLAFVPAPGFFVLADAAQPDFVRHLLPREGKQLPADASALIGWRHKKLVEIFVGRMQGQHGREGSAVVGDVQAPATLDLMPNA